MKILSPFALVGRKKRLLDYGSCIDSPGVGAHYLYDPQTSGGLLVAIDPSQAPSFIDACRRGGVRTAEIIGHVDSKSEHYLVVQP